MACSWGSYLWQKSHDFLTIAAASLGAAYQAASHVYARKLRPFFIDLVSSFLLGAWWLSSVFTGPTQPGADGAICSAFVFVEQPPEKDGERHDVTHAVREMFEYGRLCDWEEALRKEHDLPSAGWRLEIRYTSRNNKYRAVARPGAPDKLPDLLADPGPKRFPRVVHATLDSAMGNSVDVTGRVLKYLGPRNDFHGSELRVWELFPNDDTEVHKGRGYTLSLVLSDLKKTEYAYDTNDTIKI